MSHPAGGPSAQSRSGERAQPDGPLRHGYATHPGERTAEGYMPCPKCESIKVKRRRLSWGSGFLPLLVCIVHCHLCGHNYNGKTGGSITALVAVYYALWIALIAAMLLPRYL